MHRHQNSHEITTLTKYLLLDNFPLLLALNNETKHSEVAVQRAEVLSQTLHVFIWTCFFSVQTVYSCEMDDIFGTTQIPTFPLAKHCASHLTINF